MFFVTRELLLQYFCISDDVKALLVPQEMLTVPSDKYKNLNHLFLQKLIFNGIVII